jgi:hypothetical protein
MPTPQQFLFYSSVSHSLRRIRNSPVLFIKKHQEFMTHHLIRSIDSDYAWLVAVPKRQEFTQPEFHFGERVKWSGEDAQGIWFCRTGRIIGMKFTTEQGWHYQLQLDPDSIAPDMDQTVIVAAEDIKLVKDSASIRTHLKPESDWVITQQAAQALGVSPEQLRKLRRRGLSKIGHHYRDTSVPGSGLSRWQWHVERCGKALAVPPEQR